MAQITLNSSGVASSGSLLLQTNGTTTQATFDTSGNLGLGVTPSAWSGSYKAGVLNLPGGNNLAVETSNQYDMIYNAYLTSGGWVRVNADYSSIFQQSSGAFTWYSAASGSAGSSPSFSAKMTLDASGNLGIGTTSPGAVLHAKSSATGANASAIIENAGSTATALLYFKNSASRQMLIGYTGASYSGGEYGVIDVIGAYPLVFSTNDTERARIDSSGNLLVGTTSATGRIAIQQTDAGNPGLRIYASSSTFGDNVVTATADRNTTNNSFYFYSAYNNTAGAYKFRVADSGNVTNTNNSYGAISDIKLKENITDATPKLAQLKQVRVVNYNFIGSDEKQLGVIAQEIEQVFPRIVDESIDRDEEGNDLGTTTKSVKYSVFVPMLIKAIQEQQAIIENLTNRITALEQA